MIDDPCCYGFTTSGGQLHEADCPVIAATIEPLATERPGGGD